MRAKDEIKAEVVALKEMKPKVRVRSMFGDNHHAAIDGQINVLEDYLNDDDIYDRWPENEDENIRSAALEARAWLNGEADVEAPSKGWEILVR